MKFKFLLSFLCAGALAASAQGYKDGIEYYKADQFDNAKEILERNLQSADTDKALSYYYLGQIALKNGNVAEAKANFDKGIAASDACAYNYVGLGAVALKNGDAKAAKAQFDLAKKFAKKNPEVLVNIARAYYSTDPVLYAKEIDKNMNDAYKANKQHPAYFVMQGDMLLDQDKPGEAAAKYENAILFEPQSAEAYVKYANAYIRVNPQFAIDKLKELNEKVPNSALAQRELAEKYYDNEQLTRAAQQYGEYIQNPNHFKADEERYAQLLYFGQNYPQSYALAEQILAKDPNATRMQRLLFLNLAAEEKWQQAREAAEKFFAMDVASDRNNRFTATDYTTYADVLKKLGADSLAVLQVEKAYEANPDKTDLLKDLSSAYYSAKDYAKAAQAYQRFVDAGDYKTNDLYVLAGRYMTLAASLPQDSPEKTQAVDNAIKNVDAVLAKVPDDYRIAQRKARILVVANNNNPSEASNAAYNKVLELLDADPTNVEKHVDDYREAYNMIATYYIQQHDNANAKVYYTKMLELDPTNEALRNYIENLKD